MYRGLFDLLFSRLGLSVFILVVCLCFSHHKIFSSRRFFEVHRLSLGDFLFSLFLVGVAGVAGFSSARVLV